MTSACSTSASASSRRPAPSARAIADEMPPPMAPAEIICISMTRREDQRHAGQRVGAEPRHEPGLDQSGRGLRQHHQDVGPGHAQQRRHDRPVQQHARARVALDGRRRRRLRARIGVMARASRRCSCSWPLGLRSSGAGAGSCSCGAMAARRVASPVRSRRRDRARTRSRVADAAVRWPDRPAPDRRPRRSSVSTSWTLAPSGAKCRLPQASSATRTGAEIASARGQQVFVARRPLAVAAALQQPRLDQGVEAPRQHVGRDAEALLELVEARHPVQRVAQDEHAPPFAHALEAAGDRTRHVAEALALH